MATQYRVPTLGATTFITDPGRIIEYQLRFYLATVRSASSAFYTNIRSYIDTVSTLGHDRAAIAAAVSSDLLYVLKRVFYNDTQNINVDVTTRDDANWANGYQIVIKITVTIGGVIYYYSPDVTMVNGIPRLSNDTVVTSPLTSSSFNLGSKS